MKEYPNPLEQNSFTNMPSKKLIVIITYIYTKETERTYLAILMDLFEQKVVGWQYER